MFNQSGSESLYMYGHCAHDDVIKLNHSPHHWPFMRGIHRWPVDSLHKGSGKRSFDVFCILRLNKRLSKQSRRRWFETLHVRVREIIPRGGKHFFILTHWGRDKMAAISQTAFSNVFSLMKMYEFRLRFHWSLFPIPKDSINNILALVQIIVWCRPGEKPLSETMVFCFRKHICGTRLNKRYRGCWGTGKVIITRCFRLSFKTFRSQYQNGTSDGKCNLMRKIYQICFGQGTCFQGLICEILKYILGWF